MASPIRNTFSLENPDFLDSCIRAFVANARNKKKKTGGENEITDLFRGHIWGPSYYENFNYGSPMQLGNLTFDEISQRIHKNMSLKKRLVIHE